MTAPLASPSATQTQPKASGLAIAAICFSTVGLCFFPIALVGGVLGVIALIRKEASSTGKALAIVAICVFPFAVAMTGVTAAIAIPAFATYVRRSKSAEVPPHLKTLAAGVQDAYARSGELPPSLAATPEGAPSDVKRDWPANTKTAQGFAALGMAPSAPVYYVYEYVRADDGRAFVVRARGDLDADGTVSLFELEGTVAGQKVVVHGPLRIERELE